MRLRLLVQYLILDKLTQPAPAQSTSCSANALLSLYLIIPLFTIYVEESIGEPKCTMLPSWSDWRCLPKPCGVDDVAIMDEQPHHQDITMLPLQKW